MAAGYSGTPLPTKLGIKAGHRVALVGAPDGFQTTTLAGGLPTCTVVAVATPAKLAAKPCDVIVYFTKSRDDFATNLPVLRSKLAMAGGLWIAWPKAASKVPTDMTENAIRDEALPTGLVDNKVCAIDEVWSGLRLVIRKELRG